MVKVGDIAKELLVRHDIIRSLRDMHDGIARLEEKQQRNLSDMQGGVAFLKAVGEKLEGGMTATSRHSIAVMDELVVVLAEYSVAQRATLAKIKAMMDRESEALANVAVD